MRLFWINCLLLASVAAALPNARHKRDLSTIKNWIRKAIFGRQQSNIHQSPILKTENGYQLYRLPGFDNEMIRVVPRTSLVKEFVYPDLKSVNVNAFGSVVGTQSNKDTFEAVRKVNNLLRTGILNGNHNNVMKESISPMFPTLNTANYVAAENIKTDPVIEKKPPVLKEVIKPTNNYEEKIEVKVPFEPKYSYTQTKNNQPVMTYTAHNNPNVKVVETFTKTELPKCAKERIDEVIVLGANPNRLALGHEPFQFQFSPVVDISYPKVETNAFIQNPSNGRIPSEYLGTVVNSRSSPNFFTDSHIHHNEGPLKTEAINPHPVPLYSDSSDLDDVKIIPSKTSDNSFTSKTYAFSNSGNKVELSRTLGPTPPQYLTSGVSLSKRTNLNQTRVATFGTIKDNISNEMIPENVGNNYEEKIELKVPFEPKYSYTQLKNNEPVMTYTAHNNPNVKVVETFTKTELPKRLKERFDENIVLGANPNRLAHAQEVYQFQSSPIVDISYPNVETNTFIQNPSNGRIFSEHLGTVGNSRSSPTLFKDSHIRHNGRPLKTEAINPHPVPLYSDSSDLDDVKIIPSKTSDNSFTSKTYAFSNSGNKVELSRTLGPTPPQYLTSDVSLSKRTNANQTRVATFGTTKDNISNGMIPKNVGDNYEDKIELKVPFEPKYSYTQLKNNEPVMTYTAHNNPNVKVVETFTKTELPKRLKERFDENIVLGANPNRLAHAQEVYQFQSSPVVDISYPNVETNTFIQNPSNGRIFSEHLGTVGNSRSSPTLFKDSHIRHNGRPLKTEAINPHPVPLYSDSSDLDDFKMTPSKISDNSFPSKTYAFSNSGNKVDLSRTLGPTPPQYLTSDVSLSKRTNFNQTRVATFGTTKDNISNEMIPENVGNNYEEKIELKVPFEPKYSYTQTKNNEPVMTYTAHNNPNVKVMETFTKTELPKRLKERVDEGIVLGDNPNRLAHAQEVYRFQSSPVMDISYPNVETNTFIQNPSNGKILSEHLGTVVNSRSSPKRFKDSHIRHNGKPMKVQAINRRPVPLHSDSSELDDVKITPSKASDNSFTSETYAFSNSGNKVELSRTLGPTPPQYLISDVSLPKRTKANQTNVATIMARKDNISNGMIPDNVYKYQTNPNTGKMVKEDDALTADVKTDTNYYFVPSEININPATLQITKKKDGAYDNPQTPPAVSSSTNAPKEDLLNENEYIFFKGNPTVEPDIKTYSYKKKNADGSSLSIVGNKNGVMVDVKESKQINRGDIPEEQRK